MSDYLEPVVATLRGDISDFLAKMEEAKAAMRSFHETTLTPSVGGGEGERLGEDLGRDLDRGFEDVVGTGLTDGIDDALKGAESAGGGGGFEGFGEAKGALIVAGISAALAALPAAIIAASTIGLAGVGAYIEYEFNPKVKSAFQKTGKSIENDLKQAAAPLGPYLVQAATQVQQIFAGIASWLEPAFQAIGPLIQPLIAGLGNLVTLPMNGLVAMLAAPSTAKVINDVAQGLAWIGGSLSNMFADFTGRGAENSGKFFEQILVLVGDLISGLGKLSIWMADAFIEAEPYIKPVLTSLGLLFDIVKENSPIFKIMAETSLMALDVVLTTVNVALKGLLALFKLVHPYLADAANAVESFTNSGLKNLAKWANDVPGAFKSAWNAVKGWFSGAGSWLYNTGKDIVLGLIHGIEAMGSSLWNAVVRLAEDSIPSPIRKILGINSPSKLFHGFGVNIVEGLVNGITSMSSEATTATSRLANNVAEGFGGGAGRLGGSRMGGGSVNVTMNIAGTVKSDKDIRNLIQTEFLQLGARRSQTYTPYRRLAI